jgi:hypothetical protein
MCAIHFKPGIQPIPDRLLALVPAAQRKAVPGVLIGCNAVSIGISKDEGAPERAVVGLLDDANSSRFHSGMQLIERLCGSSQVQHTFLE